MISRPGRKALPAQARIQGVVWFMSRRSKVVPFWALIAGGLDRLEKDFYPASSRAA